MRKNRKYSPEFKIQCIKEMLEEHISKKELGRKYGIDTHVLRDWIKRYDENGKVTIQDSTAIQKHLAGIIKITGKTKRAADFNEDKFVTIKDATAIQKHLAKI